MMTDSTLTNLNFTETPSSLYCPHLPSQKNLDVTKFPADVAVAAPDLVRRLSRRLNEEMWGGDSDNED
jgi:hypothetical protein